MERLRTPHIIGIVQLHPQTERAVKIGYNAAHAAVGTDHILFGMTKTTEGQDLIKNLGVDPQSLIPQSPIYEIWLYKPANRLGELSISAHDALELADDERQRRGGEEITQADLLVGILQGDKDNHTTMKFATKGELKNPEQVTAFKQNLIERIQEIPQPQSA